MTKRVILSSLILCMVGCKKATSNDAKPPADQIVQKEVVEPINYSLDLKTIATNEIVSEKSNFFSLPKNNKDLPFNLRYKFNSGNLRSFKLMDTTTSHSCDQNYNGLVIELIDENGYESYVNLGSKIELVPFKDYFIKVSVGSALCSSFNFGMHIWADGNPTANPMFAQKCENSKNSQVVVFNTFVPIKIMTSEDGQNEFLSENIYCGLPLSLSPPFSGVYTHEQIYDTANYRGEVTRDDGVNFDYDVKIVNGVGTITCSKNKSPYQQMMITQCQNYILDYNQYK